MIAFTTVLHPVQEELSTHDASSCTRTDSQPPIDNFFADNQCKIASEAIANSATAHDMTCQSNIATGYAFAIPSFPSTEQLCRRRDRSPGFGQEDDGPFSGGEGLIPSDDVNDSGSFFDSDNMQRGRKPGPPVDWRLRSSELMACIRDFVHATDLVSLVSCPTTRMKQHALHQSAKEDIFSPSVDSLSSKPLIETTELPPRLLLDIPPFLDTSCVANNVFVLPKIVVTDAPLNDVSLSPPRTMCSADAAKSSLSQSPSWLSKISNRKVDVKRLDLSTSLSARHGAFLSVTRPPCFASLPPSACAKIARYRPNFESLSKATGRQACLAPTGPMGRFATLRNGMFLTVGRQSGAQGRPTILGSKFFSSLSNARGLFSWNWQKDKLQ